MRIIFGYKRILSQYTMRKPEVTGFRKEGENGVSRKRWFTVAASVLLLAAACNDVGEGHSVKPEMAIAQAIMEDQDLLILDEPINGLDKQGALAFSFEGR